MRKMLLNKHIFSTTLVLFIILFMINFLFTNIFSQTSSGSQPALYIVIDQDGVSRVHLMINVSNGLNVVRLPIKPVASTIEIISNNQSLQYMLERDVLYITSYTNTSAIVNYVADLSIDKGVFILNVTYPDVVRLEYSSNIFLLTIPREVINYIKTQNATIIDFMGPEVVNYTIVTVLAYTSTPVATGVSTVYTSYTTYTHIVVTTIPQYMTKTEKTFITLISTILSEKTTYIVTSVLSSIMRIETTFIERTTQILSTSPVTYITTHVSEALPTTLVRLSDIFTIIMIIVVIALVAAGIYMIIRKR